ncbi:MAG: DUF4093 domain-containing protein [Oscillospiraceae bacterium]
MPENKSEKIFVKQAIIVEGKYDKAILSNLVDATIIISNGFRIFKDKQKRDLIAKLANENGIIILTDSDTAGFKLRGFIHSITKNSNVINIYIPQIKGKEKRKETASKEGLLGVEGMTAKTLRDLFKKYGVEETKSPNVVDEISKMDLYNAGLIGRDCSSMLRLKLLNELDLPTYLTTNGILSVINRLQTKDEFLNLMQKIKN